MLIAQFRCRSRVSPSWLAIRIFAFDIQGQTLTLILTLREGIALAESGSRGNMGHAEDKTGIVTA
jgi:hypothetical protein